MATNTILTPTAVTRKALQILHQKLSRASAYNNLEYWWIDIPVAWHGYFLCII
jgi:hypothetical protein